MASAMTECNARVRVTVDEGNIAHDYGVLTIESEDEQFIALLKRSILPQVATISKSAIRIPILPTEKPNEQR